MLSTLVHDLFPTVTLPEGRAGICGVTTPNSAPSMVADTHKGRNKYLWAKQICDLISHSQPSFLKMIKTRLQEIKPFTQGPQLVLEVLGLEPSSPGSKANPLNPSLYCLLLAKMF